MAGMSFYREMKVRLLIPALLLCCLSCTDNIEPLKIPDSIAVNDERPLYLGNGTVGYVEAVVNPASYDILSQDTAVTLEVVESNLGTSAGTTSILYSLADITKVPGQQNTYKIGIRDLNKGKRYSDAVKLVAKTRTSEGTKRVESNPFRLEFSGNAIKNLVFYKSGNSTAILEDISLDLSSSYITVSSPFITDSKLALSFETDAAHVLVDGEEQVSGKTVNDFSKPVKISFVSAAGEAKIYTIHVKKSGLPIVYINTPSAKEIPSKTEDWLADTNLRIYDTDCNLIYSGTTGIRGRGNSTWRYPKKPYALKLDSKAEILGMPKHKRWVLLANWLDRTLLRNHISFRIAMQTDLAWTPRGQFVEVILNDKHIGNYYLCEHIKVDKNRVNIDELDDDEVDGGYVMEIDTYYDETFKFKSAVKGFPYMFKDPDEVNDSQFLYMQGFIDTLEVSLYDSERLKSREYAEYLDVESFVDWWIAYELTGNTETGHPKSTYVHKDKGGKLKAGPAWDFDWKTFRPQNNTWVTKSHLYYDALFNDPVFVATVKERWGKHRSALLEIPAFIEAEAERIRNSEEMNHAMWPVTQDTNGDIDLTFIEAVERMKKSYETKFDFMDKEISKM
jgi:hypothetical protein